MEQNKNKFIILLKKWILPLLITFIIALVIKLFFFQSYVNYDKSMYLSVLQGDFIYINKRSKLERTDIILLESPITKKYYFKRIVAIPGDMLFIKDKTVFVNKNKLELPDLIAKKYRILAFDSISEYAITKYYKFIEKPLTFIWHKL